MLVVIPSYKRTDRLRWTLLSLMQAELPTDSRRVLCVANNDPNSRVALQDLASELKAHSASAGLWEWRLLNRERTLPPIENWYSAITEMAEENEVVFLHGDDDLFLPWGLIDRHRAIVSSNADMLLSDSAHGLWFLSDGNTVSWWGPLPVRQHEMRAEPVAWGDISGDLHGWGPAFMGNHCYRYTSIFREALATSFGWCHKQSWLDWNTRTLMLTYYLPFAIRQVKGNLYGLRETCVIRGRGLEEIASAPFGVPGWNSGFLSLCAYGVFTTDPLGTYKELDPARRELANMAADWFFTFFVDKRVPASMRNETLRRIHIPLSLRLLFRMRHGVGSALRERLGFRNILLRNTLYEEAQPAMQCLESIGRLGCCEKLA